LIRIFHIAGSLGSGQRCPRVGRLSSLVHWVLREPPLASIDSAHPDLAADLRQASVGKGTKAIGKLGVSFGWGRLVRSLNPPNPQDISAGFTLALTFSTE